MLDEEGCPLAYFPFPLPMCMQGLQGEEEVEEVEGSCNHRAPLLLLLR